MSIRSSHNPNLFCLESKKQFKSILNDIKQKIAHNSHTAGTRQYFLLHKLIDYQNCCLLIKILYNVLPPDSPAQY